MRRRSHLAALAAGVVLTGCLSWSPGWETATPAAVGQAGSEARQQAKMLFEVADDGPRLEAAITAWEEILRAAPDDREALESLAEAHVLYGAAYADGKKEKGRFYRRGIQYAERGMARNTAFRNQVEAGKSLGEAARELGNEELRPMLFWVTGVSYYFKECLGGFGKVWHFRWMLRTREVMERMLAIDPEAEQGAVFFSLGIYRIAAPPGAGRDLKLSAEFLDKAIAVAPTSLLPRWGRAKYYHVKTGDREGYRRDLEWVLAQDPRAAASSYRWNVYFQRDAGKLLAEIGREF